MRILPSPFYFVRHGEADFADVFPLDYSGDVALNERGRKQALAIKPHIEQLQIQTICVSPLRRAIETKEIIAGKFECPHVIIPELTECNGAIWENMTTMAQFTEEVQEFMMRAVLGINKALSLPGPVLIVAHGGIHWAMCHYMNIQNHDKVIENCVPFHFHHAENGWNAKHLIP